MEFLKDILGEELYKQVSEKLAGNEKVKLINASDGSWIPKDKFNEKNEEAKNLQQQLNERDKQLKDLQKKAKGNEELESTIDALREANKKTKEDFESKLKAQQKDFAIETKLRNAGAKNPKAVKALLNQDAITIEGENVYGLDDQLKGLKESDSYLFGEVDNSGSGSGFNPAGGGNNEGDNKSMNSFIRTAAGR